MITCKLRDKTYHVDFVTGRALREIEPAMKVYRQISEQSERVVKGENIPLEEQINIQEAMDVMMKWFCLVFQNQFTVEEMLDGYPVDLLMHDIALTLLAVQSQTTEVLDEFPTMAAQPETETETETAKA